MHKLLLLFVVIFIYSCGANSQKDKSSLLTEKEFTSVFLDSLKKKYPGNIYIIKQDLEIDVKIGELTLTHFLNNAYTSYKNEPDSVSSIISLYLRSASDLYIEEKPIQKNKIIPLIKDAGYIDDMAITLNQNNKTNEPASLVYEKYNDKLVVVYAEDAENGIAYFTSERFKESGINKDSLFILALKNLDSVLPKIEILGEKGYYMITAGGNYEASLILLTDIWTKENIQVNGDIIISIPTRDLLLVTGSKDLDIIKKVKAVAKEAWETGPYQLLPDLFYWNGKKFEPYTK